MSMVLGEHFVFCKCRREEVCLYVELNQMNILCFVERTKGGRREGGPPCAASTAGRRPMRAWGKKREEVKNPGFLQTFLTLQ